MRIVSEFWGSPFGKVILAVCAAVLTIILWTDLRTQLFGVAPFYPHKTCYLNDPRLIWLHVTSDFLIGISYVSISLTLVYLVEKAKVPFHLAFIAFGVFIGACGGTHFMEVWTVWEPHYWLAGMLKVVTAAASLVTAIWLYPLLPQAMALIRGVELAEERRITLENTHRQLETTHIQLKAAHEKSKEMDQIKTDFFSNVSHELRTPLALIIGPARQLLAAGTLSDAQRQSMESIERNAQLLLKQVNDLLDLSKLDARRMAIVYSNVDLAALARMTIGHFDSLARERNIKLVVDAPQTLPAQVDVEKVQRILFNLLSNAFKFVPDNGAVHCAVTRSQGQITIKIQDNGPGVPEKFRSQIFQRFRQVDTGPARRVGGTGLGLSIVKEFVQLHGGLVSVSDTPGGGATFTIDLPLQAPSSVEVIEHTGAEAGAHAERLALSTLVELRPRPKPVASATPLAGDESKPLVLVVEDNVEMSQFLCDNLAGEYRVVPAYNGNEGLDKATTLRPDVIVSDVMMPQKSGDVMLTELRALPDMKNTPIIMLTAKADDDMRVRLLKQGAHDYMMKPVVIEELKARVGNLVSIKRTRQVLQTELSSTAQNLEVLARELALKQREAQSARVAAESANRSKDEFLMTLSHELRTPLTSIFGWVRMIQAGGLDAPMVSKAIDIIDRNVKVQIQLVEDLLDISRIVSGKMRLNLHTIDFAQSVRHALDISQPAADAKTITVTSSLCSSGCIVSGDADRLQQVVWNLLINAVKFTPRGGKISVSLTIAHSKAELSVSDTGQGIQPEFLPYLFERFRQADSSTTRAFGGLGLGLALVRHLVELHGGSVEAASSGVGKGATFTVRLPLLGISSEEPVAAATVESSGRKMPNLSGLSALVLEDEEDAREFIISVLSNCGCRVSDCGTAADALALLAANSYRVIVSDIGLPDENGLSFIRKVRALPDESRRKIPALALTAFAGELDKTDAFAAGFQAHLAKPVDPYELAMEVERVSRALVQ